MSSVEQSLLITIVGSITTLLGVLIALYQFQKKLPLERRTVEATANNQNAEANSVVWETYNNTFNELINRDKQILELSAKQTKLDSEIGEARDRITKLENQLKDEQTKSGDLTTKLIQSEEARREAEKRLDEEIRRRHIIQDERDRLAEQLGVNYLAIPGASGPPTFTRVPAGTTTIAPGIGDTTS